MCLSFLKLKTQPLFTFQTFFQNDPAYKADMLSRWLRPRRTEIWQGTYTTIKQTVSRLNYTHTHHNLGMILSLCEGPN